MNNIQDSQLMNFSKIGQGCMGLGGEFNRNESRDKQDIESLKMGIELGLTFLDTAEIYADGHSEELVGKASHGQRDKVFIATKFSPQNSSYAGVIAAAEASLKRLNTSYIDLYQAHWPNPKIDIKETMEALQELVRQGKIRFIGLSNFSKREMIEAKSCLSGENIFSNQVEFNLFDRYVEEDIAPYCHEIGSRVIAYSPLDKAKETKGRGGELLSSLAKKYDCSQTQLTLNWLVTQRKTIPIPKASNPTHIRQNAESLDFEIEKADLDLIDSYFPSSPYYIDPRTIKVSLEGEGSRQAYQTIDEAIINELGHTPSPSDLANFVLQGEPIKPVRLKPYVASGDQYKYELIEGRVRYWAWVIAYNWQKPVPAYIRVN
jgi:diketogulonate reductase-like aldo/keto reductase